MLTPELNERLTRVGRGTPMGTMMRKYWFPVAAASELGQKPIQRRLSCCRSSTGTPTSS